MKLKYVWQYIALVATTEERTRGVEFRSSQNLKIVARIEAGSAEQTWEWEFWEGQTSIGHVKYESLAEEERLAVVKTAIGLWREIGCDDPKDAGFRASPWSEAAAFSVDAASESMNMIFFSYIKGREWYWIISMDHPRCSIQSLLPLTQRSLSPVVFRLAFLYIPQ